MEPDALELARLGGLIVAAAALHFALQRFGRRLPVWIASRRRTNGATARTPPAAWRRRVEFALLFPKALLWVGVAWALSDQLPELQMSREAAGALITHSLDASIFTWNGRSYSAIDLVTLPALLGGLWIGVGALVRVLRSQLVHLSGGERGVHESIAILARLLLSFVGAIVIAQAWGFDVSSLTFVASVLGVGIGFGLQSIANNFVSGIVIGLERPIRPGDYVSVGVLEGTVRRIGARATSIETLDRTTILVPNARLLETEVVNWSYGDPVVRIAVPVGVAYGSDVVVVRTALLEAAKGHPLVLPDPRPSVQFLGFGESALEFSLLTWTREPERQQQLRSDLYFRIEASLRAYGIEVPFAQHDVHLQNPELLEAVRAWSRRTFGEAELEASRRSRLEAPRKAVAAPEHFEESNRWSPERLAALAARMRGEGGLALQDRRHLLTTYPRCFVGEEAVHWLVEQESLTRSEATEVGQQLLDEGVIHHVLNEHGFEDGHLYYRFSDDLAAAEPRRGAGG